MTRAHTDLDEVARDMARDFAALRAPGQPAAVDGSAEDTALCNIETFVAVALRVMRKTNPSKVRDAARTVNIKALLDGTPPVGART